MGVKSLVLVLISGYKFVYVTIVPKDATIFPEAIKVIHEKNRLVNQLCYIYSCYH